MGMVEIFQFPCADGPKLEILLLFKLILPKLNCVSPFFPSFLGHENNSIHIKLEAERDGALVSHMCH